MLKIALKILIFYFSGLTFLELTPFFIRPVEGEYKYKKYLFKKNLSFKTEELKDFEKNYIFQDDLNKYMELLKNDLIKFDNKFINFFALNNKDKIEQTTIDLDSDIQYQEGNIIYAEGNAVIYFSNASLRGDKVKYDSDSKEITVEGNVIFIKGKQYFEASKVFFNFEKNNGYIDNIYGVLNAKSISSDLEILDIDQDKTIPQEGRTEVEDLRRINSVSLVFENDIEKTKKINITKLNFDIPSINIWRFKSDKLIFSDNLLKSDHFIFTNDALNEPQFLLESKNFTAEIIEDKIKLISEKNWIILDNKIKFPIGKRTIFDKDQIVRWGIGSDFKEKDGFYIFRNFDEINLSNSFALNLQPYFLIQRAIKGNTNSFREPKSSILSDKKKNDIDFSDMFALDSDLTGSLNSWKILLNTQFNSLNPNRISEATRAKLTFNRSFDLNENKDKNIDDINLKKEQNTNFSNFLDLKLFSSYREKVSRGYSGEEEIYFGTGIELENNKTWELDKKQTKLTTLYGIGEFKAKSKGANVHKTLFRNIFAAKYSYKFPLWVKDGLDQSIDIKYKYSPAVINQSLFWNINILSSIFVYSDDSSQKVIKLATGPKLILGEFKNNFLDYSSLDIKTSYFIKDGESPFAFDNVDESFRINLSLDQQIYGPLVFSYKNSYNFDNSKFAKGNYGLDFRRRAYSFGAFYNANNESLGIRFKIFNFDYTGLSPKF